MFGNEKYEDLAHGGNGIDAISFYISLSLFILFVTGDKQSIKTWRNLQ